METSPPAPSWRILAIAFTILVGALGGILAVAPAVPAVTVVEGPITTDTTWGPPSETEYWVVGNVTVLPGVRLTILPGTTLRFSVGVGLFVEGALIADGTPASPISFLPNATVVPAAWTGIQFNASATGSVSWATIARAVRAVTAMDSSPSVHNNTVPTADAGFAFLRSSTVLADNQVGRAALGIYLNASDVQVLRNSINGTIGGIRVEGGGSPRIEGNAITNVTSGFAYGIFVSGGASVDIVDNAILGVRGFRGDSGVSPGEPGRGGGFAIAILVDGAPSANIVGNRIDLVSGGRGGDGQGNASGTGGRAGDGGPAGAIVVNGTARVSIDWNTITSVSGGRGGNGGGDLLTNEGGKGGTGGDAAAFQVANVKSATSWYGNVIDGISGGRGGSGGNGTLGARGGDGGDVFGLTAWSATDADVSFNSFANLQGGPGGNGSSTGSGNRFGGRGGESLAIALFGVAGSAVFESNEIFGIVGGDGGTGRSGGGAGGNATGFLVFGNGDGRFNNSQFGNNSVQGLSGGDGGIGFNAGGDGGVAMAAGVALVTPALIQNWMFDVRGGDGGDALGGPGVGRGGDASGIGLFVVRDAVSRRDIVDTVRRGLPGAGGPVTLASGSGYHMEGDPTFTARVTVENATIANIDDFDIRAGPHAQGTTINTPFSSAKVFVDPTGTLTVRNFLAVDVLWPNGVTFVAGASIRVEDNGLGVWDFVASTGRAQWLLVTDRVYVGSNVPADNSTVVTITYLSYGFASNPRSVDMAESHPETFVMIDSDVPYSSADPLPPYTTTSTFSVSYTASDGNGSGLSNITLFYRIANGAWIAYATQAASSFGSFLFMVSGDGPHAFATVVRDAAGNTETGPAGNDTWTIVDRMEPATSAFPSGTAGNAGWYRSAVTVTLAAEDATSGVESTEYRIDGGPWQPYAGPFTIATDGTHTVDYHSRDRAGNSEEPHRLILRIDTEAPSTSVSLSGTLGGNGWYLSSVVVNLTAADASSGVASISYRVDGGTWQAYSAPFTLSDGAHTVEFASTDVAGNVEVARSTAVGVDTIRPSVVTGAPRGSDVNSTPAITITFSEPMDRASVEQAFSITPDISGTFAWSPDSQTVTFTPDRPLGAFTTYVVFIDSAARDVVGNPMSQAYTFSFSTAAAPGGFAFADMWWLFLLIGAVTGAALLLVMRRRRAPAQPPARPAAVAKTPTTIDDVFLLYRDGILIKHETRRLKPDIDTDILSGMLTAVQQFVKDSFRTEEGELDELTFGGIHILIGRGKWLILAAMVTGDDTSTMSAQIKRCVVDMEDHHWDQLEDWDGDMVLAKVLAPYIKKLIGGDYIRPTSEAVPLTPEAS